MNMKMLMIEFLLFLLSYVIIIFTECILTPILALYVGGVCTWLYIYSGRGAITDVSLDGGIWSLFI